jgi:hypothetical protein
MCDPYDTHAAATQFSNQSIPVTNHFASEVLAWYGGL